MASKSNCDIGWRAECISCKIIMHIYNRTFLHFLIDLSNDMLQLPKNGKFLDVLWFLICPINCICLLSNPMDNQNAMQFFLFVECALETKHFEFSHFFQIGIILSKRGWYYLEKILNKTRLTKSRKSWHWKLEWIFFFFQHPWIDRKSIVVMVSWVFANFFYLNRACSISSKP